MTSSPHGQYPWKVGPVANVEDLPGDFFGSERERCLAAERNWLRAHWALLILARPTQESDITAVRRSGPSNV